MTAKQPTIILVLSVLSVIIAHSSAVVAQDFGKYFELRAEKYKEAEGEYVGVSPLVIEKAQDPLGRFIVSHRRRFAYILANRTKFQGLDSYYPDTKKINRLYLTSLKKNNKFIGYFNNLIGPTRTPAEAKETISEQEVMSVASKFFFCSAVRKDNSINPYICVTLNGVKEAEFAKDYTLLEAICFEAIFEMIEKAAPKRASVVENFLRYVDEVSEAEKVKLPDSNAYLLAVRKGVFLKMESDTLLRNAMVDFIKRNELNLPFRLAE